MTTATSLSRVADLIVAQRDVSDILRVAVSASRGLLRSDAAFAGLRREDGSYAMRLGEGLLGARFGTLVLSRGVGLAGLVAEQRGSVLVDDYLNDARFLKPPDLLDVVVGDERFHTIACVPVLGSNDNVLALLYVAERSPGGMAGDAVRMVETIAGYATLRARLLTAESRERELVTLIERQRLASELHDSVAQTLFAMGVEVRRLRADGELPGHVADALLELDRMAGRAGRELRESLYAAARIPDRVALELALAGEASRFEDATGCSVVVTYAGALPKLSALAEHLILDTLREGLRNVAKHAGAASVLVHVRTEREQVSVSIHDDGTSAGRDFPPTRSIHGAGLSLLRHRIRALGGTISFEPSDDGGHRLTLVLPETAYG